MSIIALCSIGSNLSNALANEIVALKREYVRVIPCS